MKMFPLVYICAFSMGYAPWGIGLNTAPLPHTRVLACFQDSMTEQACWSSLQAEKSPSDAYDFGVHYVNGDGIDQNLAYGRYWIHRAALVGYPLGQYNVGVMFFEGLGGGRSASCARYWFRQAAQDTGAIGEMAREALHGITAFDLGDSTAPRVLRVLSEEECEQLPEVVFSPSQPTPSVWLSIDDGKTMEVQDSTTFIIASLMRLVPVSSSTSIPEGLASRLSQVYSLTESQDDAVSSAAEVMRKKLEHTFIVLGEVLLNSNRALREVEREGRACCK